MVAVRVQLYNRASSPNSLPGPMVPRSSPRIITCTSPTVKIMRNFVTVHCDYVPLSTPEWHTYMYVHAYAFIYMHIYIHNTCIYIIIHITKYSITVNPLVNITL